MTPLDRLIALTAVSIQDATASYLKTGNLRAWEKAMEQAIRTSTTATYLAATAQRLDMDLNSPLFKQNRLTRAERADINRQVNGQLTYLRGFVADIGNLSPAQIMARANLYATGQKSFYYAQRWGDWDIPADLLPGNQQCMGQCKCALTDVKDNGDGSGTLTRVMLGRENHCDDCPPLAGDHIVYRRKAA